MFENVAGNKSTEVVSGCAVPCTWSWLHQRLELTPAGLQPWLVERQEPL
jgi:hypothetical protein